MTGRQQKILVIRLGALGDLVFCFQSFDEIRRAHPQAEITLLTRAPFAGFARLMPWFDRIMIERSPRAAQPLQWLRLRQEIKKFAPDFIYDLQGKKRQTVLYALLGGPFGPPWSGAAPWCKYPRPWPPTHGMHFSAFLAAQLRRADVPATPPADLSWLDAPTGKFGLPDRYAVLIAGSSPDAPHKRWPPEKYALLARQLQAQNIRTVAVGAAADQAAVALMQQIDKDTVNLCGQTTLPELAGIFRKAVIVIGNDTGPTHLASSLGTPTLALFSAQSNPLWSRPPGKRSAVLQSPELKDLEVERVLSAVAALRETDARPAR